MPSITPIGNIQYTQTELALINELKQKNYDAIQSQNKKDYYQAYLTYQEIIKIINNLPSECRHLPLIQRHEAHAYHGVATCFKEWGLIEKNKDDIKQLNLFFVAYHNIEKATATAPENDNWSAPHLVDTFL